MHYDCKNAVKSGDKTYLCNKQSCEKNAQGKPNGKRCAQAKSMDSDIEKKEFVNKENKDRQAKEQKNTPN